MEFNTTLDRRQLLEAALGALSNRRFDEAETLLSEARLHAPHDCVAWNLLGIVHECRAEWKQARRCYGKAIAADSWFSPAQQNMRRVYELYTFGQSNEPIAFGMMSRRWNSPEVSQTKGEVLSTAS